MHAKRKPVRSYSSAFIRSSVNLNKKHTYVYGGTCLATADSGGFERVALGYPQSVREAVISAVANSLIVHRHNWTVAMLVFHKDGDRETYKVIFREYRNVKCDQLDALGTKDFQAFVAEQPDTKVSTGFVCVPELGAEFGHIMPDILRFFADSGAWDKDRIAVNTLEKIVRSDADKGPTEPWSE